MLSKNQVRLLAWLLLEKEGYFLGGKWVVEACRCLHHPTLSFRFSMGQGEGVVEVGLSCMYFSMEAGDAHEFGHLKDESRQRFVDFALRLFPKDPVLVGLKGYGRERPN
jgi:hypothetical protein